MKKKLALSAVILTMAAGSLISKDTNLAKGEQLQIAFVDSFEAMRKCKDGEKVSLKIDELRDDASKKIRAEAEKLAKVEMDLKQKAAMLKPQELSKQERNLRNKKIELEDLVKEKEEEIKITMQQETEKLAMQVEEGIRAVAQEKDLDAVIDKMTGRVMYTKDNNKGDITADAIQFVDHKSAILAQAKDTDKATAPTTMAKAEQKSKSAAA